MVQQIDYSQVNQIDLDNEIMITNIRHQELIMKASNHFIEKHLISFLNV